MARRKFQLDKANGKAMGVCAGIANFTGIDVTIIRIAAVLLTIFGGFPWTLIAYGAAAWFGDRKPASRNALSGATRRDMRETINDLDRRMAAIDAEVAGADSRLSREIEALR